MTPKPGPDPGTSIWVPRVIKAALEARAVGDESLGSVIGRLLSATAPNPDSPEARAGVTRA